MSEVNWDVPQTEAGLQALLSQLEERRTVGDDLAVGFGLLALAHLVKWVRSDNHEPPFVRARTLAVEAYEIFRRLGEGRGQVLSLLMAVPMSDAETAEKLWIEAERLAEGDQDLTARVMSSRARSLALRDRTKASELNLRALEIFRHTGNLQGQAVCLLSLSISDGTSDQKRDAALEAADLFRQVGDHASAGRAISIALMNAEELQPLVELEPMVRAGLGDALAAGNRSQEALYYDKLAEIAAARGDVEEARKYRQWAEDVASSDGRSPRERWEDDVEMTKMMIAMAKRGDEKEALTSFQEELDRLLAAEPPSSS